MRFINLKTGADEAFISRPAVLCIGDFDGVHLGHRQLVASVLQQREIMKSEYPTIACGAWFFDSTSYKGADGIYSIKEKLETFASLGLDYALIADFDEMKSLTPEEFVNDVLKDLCKCVHAVCGENFRFGARASGDCARLCELMGGNVTVVPLLSFDGTVISSTYIRELLSEGEIEKANYLLGGNYSISETVIHGKALGRKIGIPTINQNPENKKLILRSGIYATLCHIDDEIYHGVTNIGTRPTVENTYENNIETHIIGFEGDCYGKRVKTEFVKRVRDEMRFESVDALKAQIQKDIEFTKVLFNI